MSFPCLSIILIVTSTFSFTIRAKEEVNQERLSSKYREGAHLVYDCQDLHYVCASDENSKKCAFLLKESLVRRQSLPDCMPIEDFSSFKECSAKQQYLIDHPIKGGVCRHFYQLELEKIYFEN